ncbi:hypothetical protein PR202_gb16056 [Eleusine coracana subsp. coracana]|uniref:Uncharacterized protein n=1 Tax=Eleusine coracana subsp. coracana TaxID=191504 RepID=A0AAV5F042_ELECO|nr:hypothetical protein PR202_gb16056 [Eleusine coracana subsp. coracana]
MTSRILSFFTLSLQLTLLLQESGSLSMKRVNLLLGSGELSIALVQLVLQLIACIALDDDLNIMELLKKIGPLQLASVQLVLKNCNLSVTLYDLDITGRKCGLQRLALSFQLQNAGDKVLRVLHELANVHLLE